MRKNTPLSAIRLLSSKSTSDLSNKPSELHCGQHPLDLPHKLDNLEPKISKPQFVNLGQKAKEDASNIQLARKKIRVGKHLGQKTTFDRLAINQAQEYLTEKKMLGESGHKSVEGFNPYRVMDVQRPDPPLLPHNG